MENAETLAQNEQQTKIKDTCNRRAYLVKELEIETKIRNPQRKGPSKLSAKISA